MEHVNGWCFRGIYKGGLWEDDLHVSAHEKWEKAFRCLVVLLKKNLN